MTKKKTSSFHISFDDLTSYLHKKNVSIVCKECGASDPTINVDDQDHVNIINMNILNQEDKDYHVFNIECGNCHHMRFFNSISIEKDILKMKEEGTFIDEE